MIPDITPHNGSELDFSIFFQGALLGGHLLKFLNLVTAYNSHPIELKLGRMILDISSHNRSESDFPISPWGRC